MNTSYNAEYSEALDIWYYVVKWEDMPEFAGILDYVNREVTMTVKAESHTVLIADRPLSFNK